MISFDLNTNTVFSDKIENNKELAHIFSILDNLEAKGNWTNIVGVMGESLDMVQLLKKDHPNKKVTIVIYTDGKHDMPKGSPGADFNELLAKYYGNYNPKQKDWFIYYIELDEENPEFKQFLDKTGSGVAIDGKDMSNDENFDFTKINRTEMAVGGLGGLIFLLLLYILNNLRKPWFGDHVLLNRSSNKQINLSYYRKPLLFRRLTLGSSAQVMISGPGIKSKHAILGVTSHGEFYIRPIANNLLKIGNHIIKEKKFIASGQPFTIGETTFELVIRS